MLVSKLVMAPFSLVSRGVLRAREDDDEADDVPDSLDDDGDDGSGSHSPTGTLPVGSGTGRPTNILGLPTGLPTGLPIGLLTGLPTGFPGVFLTLSPPAIKSTQTTTSPGTTTSVVDVTHSTTSTPTPLAFSTIASLPYFTLTTFPSTTLSTSIASGVTGAVSRPASIISSATPHSIPSATTYINTMSSSTGDGANNRTLIITLSTVLSVVGAVIIVISSYLCFRNRRRRAKLFNRGITPIGDDEIASWKLNKSTNEKTSERFTRKPSTSSHNHRRELSNSLIQYQSHIRPSLDTSPKSPRSFMYKQSFDLPRTPQSAVLAVAPNARTGLTDDTIPGDDPFVTTPKRHPSKLYKLPPNSPSGHRAQGSRGSRSSSVKSFADAWYGETMALSPRTSTDVPSSSRGQPRKHSIPTAPPHLSLSDNEMLTGLSPPPLHRAEIGRALG